MSLVACFVSFVGTNGLLETETGGGFTINFIPAPAVVTVVARRRRVCGTTDVNERNNLTKCARGKRIPSQIKNQSDQRCRTPRRVVC